MMKRSWWSRIAAVGGVVALLFAGSVAGATSAQAWDSGRGFTLFGNKDTKNRPSYTIRFSSARLQNAAKPLFERAVGELHSFANTRVRFAGVGPRTNAVDEIFVAEAVVRSCAGVAWGEWDGCTSIKRPGNVVSSAYIELRYDNLIGGKSKDYKNSMVSHELGHALGLDHSSNSGQLMHSVVNSTDFAGDKTYKSGDRAGLNYLARSTPTPPSTPTVRVGLGARSERQVFYADETGRPRLSWWDGDSWKDTQIGDNSSIRVRVGSPLVVNDESSQVYFISRDNQLMNASFKGGGKWTLEPLQIDALRVHGNSDLVYAQNKLYFVSAAGKLANAYRDNNRWVLQEISDSAKPRLGTALAVNNESTQVYFVTDKNQLANLSWQSGRWVLHKMDGPTGVQAGSDVAYARKKVYYVNEKGSVANTYWQDGMWKFEPINDSAQPRRGTPLAVNDESTQVFFVTNKDRVANIYWKNGKWNLQHLTGDDNQFKVRAGSDLTLAGGHVFFVNQSQKVAHAYRDGNSWKFGSIGGHPNS